MHAQYTTLLSVTMDHLLVFGEVKFELKANELVGVEALDVWTPNRSNPNKSSLALPPPAGELNSIPL